MKFRSIFHVAIHNSFNCIIPCMIRCFPKYVRNGPMISNSGSHPLTFLSQHIGYQDQYIATSNIIWRNSPFISIILSLRNVCCRLRRIAIRSTNLCFLELNTIFLLRLQSFKFLLVNLFRLIIIDSRLKDIFLEIKIRDLF